MHFAFSSEQEELRHSVRRFLEAKSPISEVRRLMETTDGYDKATWSRMGSELALQGLHIPEAYGGQGFTSIELTIALEEMGRSLLCAPFFSSVCLAATAILNAGSEEQKIALLPTVASGETVATLAFTEPNGQWDIDAVEMVATQGSDGSWYLDGQKSFVLDGQSAELIVVAARIADTANKDIALFIVQGDPPGLNRAPLPTMDQTRRQAHLTFTDVPAELLGNRSTGARALATTLNEAAIFLSAEMVGGAQRCLEMAVDYAKERIQFGRPIGSFQSIQHKCADMLVEVESAKAATYHAAWAAAEGEDDLSVTASFAKAYSSDAYFHVAAQNIQIHGGLGFTWEHDAHLYFKRAKSSGLILGDSAYHRELVAQQIGV